MINFAKGFYNLISFSSGKEELPVIMPALPLKNVPLILLTSLIDSKSRHIMLADDDIDDRETFVEAIKLIAPHVTVTLETDGVELMKKLNSPDSAIPDILFLDLNMPRKNGFECLEEIRTTARVKTVPVVIYSTSSNPEFISNTYNKGANFYMIKPQSFKEIKRMMQKVLSMGVSGFFPQPARSEFILRAD